LPSGRVLELSDSTPRIYLHHRSELGEFFLSSDAVIPTFARARRLAHIINQIPVEEREAFKYRGERSPLSHALARYADFFGLFGDFRGYVAHFLLQDLVTEDCSAVRFFAPFEEFTTAPLPGDMDAYRAYRQLAVAFIEVRNRRILASC